MEQTAKKPRYEDYGYINKGCFTCHQPITTAKEGKHFTLNEVLPEIIPETKLSEALRKITKSIDENIWNTPAELCKPCFTATYFTIKFTNSCEKSLQRSVDNRKRGTTSQTLLCMICNEKMFDDKKIGTGRKLIKCPEFTFLDAVKSLSNDVEWSGFVCQTCYDIADTAKCFEKMCNMSLDRDMDLFDKLKQITELRNILTNNGNSGGSHETKLILPMDKVSEKINCPDCGNVYTSRKIFLVHKMKEHAGYTCKICNKVLATESGLEKHNEAVHKEKKSTVKCRFCVCEFGTQKAVLRHEKKHGEYNTDLQCRYCGEKFAQKPVFWKHVVYKTCVKQKQTSTH